MLFSFVQVFGYFGTLEKIPKKYIKNQRSGSFHQAKGGPQGSQGAAKRVPGAASPWPCHLPSWVGPTPPGALHRPLFIFPLRKRRNKSRFFDLRRGIAEPSVLPRRANLEAELASGEGEILASPSPLHDFSSNV